MTLSMDLKKRALEAYRNGEGSQTQIARRFKIAQSTLHRWLHQPDTPEDKPETRGRPPALSPQDLDRLADLARRHHSASERELAVMLAGPDQQPLHRSIIGRALRKMGLTRKKRRGAPLSATEKTSKTPEESG